MCPALVCGAVCRPAGEKRHSTVIECGNDTSTQLTLARLQTGMVCVCVCVCVCVRVCACVDAVSMYSMLGVGCESVHVDILVCELWVYVVCNYVYIQCWCCWWSILLNVCVHAVWLCPFQVLHLIHASFGFEMEAFEFLNILQAHA